MVYHVGGGSLGYSSPHKTYLNFRNSLIVLTKNLHNGWSWWWLFRRLVLDGFAALKFLLEGHAAHAWQVGTGAPALLPALTPVIRQRRELMATGTRTGPDRDVPSQYRLRSVHPRLEDASNSWIKSAFR